MEKLNPIDLLDKYESSKGTILINNLRHLQTSHYIIIKNHRDLIRIINAVERDIMIMSQTNKEKFNLAMREITRQLHNYLASIQSLIEHTRRFREVLNNSELEKMVMKEISKLTSNNCAIFARRFRNYIQHYKLPIVAAHLTISRKDIDEPDFEEDLTVMLNSDKLLEWDGWNQSCKDFINSYGKELPLKEIFEDYQKLNNKFYEWFYDKVMELYKNELDEFRKLSQKLDELFKK